MIWLRRLYSWWVGRKIGEHGFNYYLTSGDLDHFLPVEMWDDAMKRRIKKIYFVKVWDGFGWANTDQFASASPGQPLVIHPPGVDP